MMAGKDGLVHSKMMGREQAAATLTQIGVGTTLVEGYASAIDTAEGPDNQQQHECIQELMR